MNPVPLSLSLVITQEEATLALSGELDMASRSRVSTAFEDLPPCDRYVIDLRGLSFMDCSGLSCLLAIASDGLPVRFIRGPRNVQKVFEITDTADKVEWVEVEAAQLTDRR